MTVFAQQSLRLFDPIYLLAARDGAILTALIAGAVAVYLLLPRPRPFPTWAGAAVGLGALILLGVALLRPLAVSPEVVLFGAFSFLTLAAGGLLVTQDNPARAAMSFALVILSTCGLFLLLAAPFLMAATVIVYAGAIIVTFLFVIMLAQQHGHSDADMRSREPALATLTGFLLLGVLVYVIRLGHDSGRFDGLLAATAAAREAEDGKTLKDRVNPSPVEGSTDKDLFSQAERLLAELGYASLEQQAAQLEWDWVALAQDNPERIDVAKARDLLARLETALLAGKDRLGLAPTRAGRGTDPSEVRRDERTRVPHLPAENSAYLGKALFTDFLLPVELGGMLLLVATVGAIAIAQRRDPGDRRTAGVTWADDQAAGRTP